MRALHAHSATHTDCLPPAKADERPLEAESSLSFCLQESFSRPLKVQSPESVNICSCLIHHLVVILLNYIKK